MSINGTTGTTLAPTSAATSSALGGQSTTTSIDPLLDKNAFLKLMMTSCSTRTRSTRATRRSTSGNSRR